MLMIRVNVRSALPVYNALIQAWPTHLSTSSVLSMLRLLSGPSVTLRVLARSSNAQEAATVLLELEMATIRFNFVMKVTIAQVLVHSSSVRPVVSRIRQAASHAKPADHTITAKATIVTALSPRTLDKSVDRADTVLQRPCLRASARSTSTSIPARSERTTLTRVLETSLTVSPATKATTASSRVC